MSTFKEYIKLRDVDSSLYCPISVKDEKNTPVINYFDTATNTDLFLSKKNIYNVARYILSINKITTPCNTLATMNNRISRLMKKWSISENLNDFEYVYNDPSIILSFLNKVFLTKHEYLINKKNSNVFRVNDVVSDQCGISKLKKYEEMTADEYKTLDIWKSQQLYTNNKRYRYENKIPIWQKSMNIRHYDKNNDGLHSADSNRSSLNTQIRGYDMSNIIKGSEFYKVPAYEFI